MYPDHCQTDTRTSKKDGVVVLVAVGRLASSLNHNFCGCTSYPLCPILSSNGFIILRGRPLAGMY